MGRTVLAAAMLIVISLAGCNDAPEDLADPFDDELEATETTGLLRGVVVDGSVTPVVNATVHVRHGANPVGAVQTDQEGAFGMDALEPGLYTLDISKPGFISAQVATTVAAGVEAPPLVKVQIERLSDGAPFHNLFQWEGYIMCNTTNANLCLIINYYPNFVLGLAGQSIGPLVNDESYVTFYEEFVSLNRHPHWLQAETVWESTQPLGDRINFRYEAANLDEDFVIPCSFASGAQSSPAFFAANHSVLQDGGLGAGDPDPDPDDDSDGECDVEEPQGFVIETFAGTPCYDAGVTCVNLYGVILEQEISTFIAAFYDYVPPEEWRFVDDSNVPPPPQ